MEKWNTCTVFYSRRQVAYQMLKIGNYLILKVFTNFKNSVKTKNEKIK